MPASNSAAATAAQAIGSNSLADLAARIKDEHEACQLAMKRGLAHAVNAGKLLIEAKAQLGHGEWLPWLRNNCGIPERTCRDYMHFARHAAESANLADLTKRGAELLETEPAAESADVLGWAREFLGAPFSKPDLEADDSRWLKIKLMTQLGVPPIAEWCFSVMENEPPLRLCPWNELEQTAKALAPIAKEQAALKFDTETFDSLVELRHAINDVELLVTWMLGRVLTEIEYRFSISDETYKSEWDETHKRVMAHLDEQLAESRGKTDGAATSSAG